MVLRQLTYVMTVYGKKSRRLPTIASYKTVGEADSFIRAALEWGIDVKSCEKIDEDQALRLIAEGAVDER